MKTIRTICTLSIALILSSLLIACQDAQLSLAKVQVSSVATGTGASADLAARAISAGTPVTTISSYQVSFKKIEIGNSETDKYTLWEDAAGVTKDIVTAVNFDGVQPIKAGSYQFVRLTIGTTLNVAGSILDGSTLYVGTGSTLLSDSVYLWGTSVLNSAGQITLATPVTVQDGSCLSFNFDVAGTVSYGSGPASAAILGVSKPVLSISVK